MDVFQSLRICPGVLSLQINNLPANHSVNRACPSSYFFDDFHASFSRAAQARKNLISLGLQSISGQDGDCLPKNLVAGGAAAPQVIIVEGRQIIVDERVSV